MTGAMKGGYLVEHWVEHWADRTERKMEHGLADLWAVELGKQ
jgi:hypothetical protein